jgi:Ala-tRNA(Pro) deacylase
MPEMTNDAGARAHLTPPRLLERLGELGIAFKNHEHEAVFTVEESRHVKQAIPGAHTKNLFVKDKKDNYFLIVAEGSVQIPMNQVHTLVGGKSRLSFANAEKLMEYLGVTPGSVTAFAAVNDVGGNVRVVIDEALLSSALINCHPLTNTMTTTISKGDLLRFLEACGHAPLIVALSSPLPESQAEVPVPRQ